MSEPGKSLNIVCLATFFKGTDFIRECKSHGCQVVLITKEKMLSENWPRESLDDLIALPNDAGSDLFIHLMSLLGRQTRIDRVVALEEFDVITAASMREHFCLPGMTSGTARLFRDKWAMAIKAREARLVAPDFVPLLNYDEIRAFLERVKPPWIIKPRSDVSAIGIKKVQEPTEVWEAIDELDSRERFRERAAHHLLARFVAGDVFHVDSVVSKNRVIFAGTNQYGRPPMDVAHKGGAYISYSVARGSSDEKLLLAANRKLVREMGLEQGATHAEFIKSSEDGQFYFLEIAARVGGAYIADVLEAASGVNLWREWARLEVGANPSGRIIPARREYAGIVLSLSQQEWPDTTSYDDGEIAYRVHKRHHVGLIVRSPKVERVKELLDDYARRFATDFAATMPPLERAE
ncbi:MAG: ATP-grasp domain-containing protein [bacterium]